MFRIIPNCKPGAPLIGNERVQLVRTSEFTLCKYSLLLPTKVNRNILFTDTKESSCQIYGVIEMI